MTATRPALRTLAGIALVAGCTLALQVLLTRLFSAVLFYHFGFLAISLALLGIGAGASIPGALLGARLTGKLSEQGLLRAVGCILVVAGAVTIGQAL